MSKTHSSSPHRFAVALSFPGERRNYVEQVSNARLPSFGGEQGNARICVLVHIPRVPTPAPVSRSSAPSHLNPARTVNAQPGQHSKRNNNPHKRKMLFLLPNGSSPTKESPQ